MGTGPGVTAATLRLSLLLVMACFGACLKGAATSGGSLETADFFVSGQGKDTWSGRLADPGESDGPFVTVARARDAVRVLLKTQKEPRCVRVVVRGGTYYLDSALAHCGRFTPEAVGVFVGDNANNKVIHNHIYDLFYSGVSVGSVQDFGPSEARGNIIEYNHIHDIGQGVLSDLAGIYTCSTPGSRIAYNVVHNVVRRDYGGWGIYPDEGSHDLLIQKNLVYGCQDGALFAHHNHDITAENNIFAFNRTAQVERGGIGGFELTCRRSLIYYLEGKAVGDYGGENWGRDVCAFDRNLYWNASGQPVLFANKSLSAWQAGGQDKDSLVADPLFLDPAHGDFTLRPGSPAAQIGFEPWDISAVGPRPSSMTSLIARAAEIHGRHIPSTRRTILTRSMEIPTKTARAKRFTQSRCRPSPVPEYGN